MNTDTILKELKETYPHQPTFLQTAEEIVHSLSSVIEASSTKEEDLKILKRMLIPERIISFRVDWVDDAGEMQTNTGYRVQYNSALGPYKGGLRFDASVNEDILKFLGFEQIFKNALTGLQLGGGKGGADFNPKGKSENEIRSFCRALMSKLYRHIGINTDVPAGDIGVGGREIGYLFGMYKELTKQNEGVLTGKDELFGGSCGRTEATGHGVVYFADAMAKHHDFELKGMTAVVSGSGNVAEFTARKLISMGSTVLTLSDRGGYVHKPDGLTHLDITHIAKEKDDGKSLADISIEGANYNEGKAWQAVAADAYFPCATQNEVDEEDAKAMVKSAKLIVEGANMPLTAEALEVVRKAETLYAPGKASNAGGVSVSGIEMAQNAGQYAWSCEKVDEELQRIMKHIHAQCVANGKGEDGSIDYVDGANIAGFKRVVGAMKKLGW